MSVKQVTKYFDGIVPANLSGGGWKPAKTWLRVHGDTKSSVGGAFHMETMKATDGSFIAKLVGYPDGKSTQVIVAAAGAAEPTLPAVATALRNAVGV